MIFFRRTPAPKTLWSLSGITYSVSSPLDMAFLVEFDLKSRSAEVDFWGVLDAKA